VSQTAAWLPVANSFDLGADCARLASILSSPDDMVDAAMLVSPSATSPASTSDADARKSEASTGAPVSCTGPSTVATRPSIVNARAHSLQFRNVHESIFENSFSNYRAPF